MSWKRHDGRAISKGKDSVFRQVRKLKAKEIVLFPDFLRLYRAEKQLNHPRTLTFRKFR
jgi:hypothetical protein